MLKEIWGDDFIDKQHILLLILCGFIFCEIKNIKHKCIILTTSLSINTMPRFAETPALNHSLYYLEGKQIPILFL